MRWQQKELKAKLNCVYLPAIAFESSDAKIKRKQTNIQP